MPKTPVLRSSLALAALLLGTVGTSLPARPSHDRRLPKGYHWGRCLLVVDGQTRISGRCSYTLMKGGDFTIEGPRQVHEGIDYTYAEAGGAGESADYWASIFNEKGAWDGFGNDDVRATHGDFPDFGPMRRNGACWVSKIAIACLWKE